MPLYVLDIKKFFVECDSDDLVTQAKYKAKGYKEVSSVPSTKVYSTGGMELFYKKNVPFLVILPYNSYAVSYNALRSMIKRQSDILYIKQNGPLGHPSTLDNLHTICDRLKIPRYPTVQQQKAAFKAHNVIVRTPGY